MTIKTQIFAIVTILIILAVLFIQNPIKKDTLARLAVLEETENYVEVRAGDHVGRLYKEFSFDFEAQSFDQWFGAASWTGMLLQSPINPTIATAQKLSDDIINANAGFADNSIDADAGAARFVSQAPIGGMATSSAALVNTQMWFINGDDLWFRARFSVASGLPNTLVGFTDNSTEGSPGINIDLDEGGRISVALKGAKTAKLGPSDATIPRRQWFTLTVHLVLSSTKSGQVELWLDDSLILDGTMRTLPTKGALLNSFAIGITAADGAAELFVDDVLLSHSAP